MDLVRIYRIFLKMMRYPDLLGEMRRLYLKALTEKGLNNEEAIRMEAKAMIETERKPLTEENLKAYTDALIDLHFISHFSDEAIENYINLANKNALFRKLNRVVNTERATPGKIRKALREFCEIPQGDLFLNESEVEGVRVALINHFISNHLPIIGIAKRHITIRDIDEMLTSSFSTPRRPGKIGGKATGLLIAHKILLPRLTERDPELEKYVTVPESYYFNSGIFSDFTDYNGLYSFYSQKYNTYEAIEENYRNIGEVFAKASFPGDVVEMFRKFLESVGEHPLILRSSSLLEDNFGFAFSGKYDSVFIANRGDIETRLAAFIQGLKQVHMSTFAQAPLLYRRDHKLLDYDEKMSVLVQKVIGRRFGNYFFPFAAGVAFSHNPYRWTLRIRREEGIVRLVFGLGTTAVDRVGQGYPRLIPLSHPQLRPESGIRQVVKYSQRMVELMNLESGAIESHSFDEVMNLVGPDDRFPGPLHGPGRVAGSAALRDAGYRRGEGMHHLRQFPHADPLRPPHEKDPSEAGVGIRAAGGHRIRLGPGQALPPAVPDPLRSGRSCRGPHARRHRRGGPAVQKQPCGLQQHRARHRVRGLRGPEGLQPPGTPMRTSWPSAEWSAS